MEIAARDHALWVGGPTESYCPFSGQPQNQCPPGDVAAFLFNNKRVGMDTDVPGGQDLFIAPNGRVKYTKAHSNFMPPGSKFKKFSHGPFPGKPNLDILRWDDGNFVACRENGEWAIYIPRSPGTTTGCLPFRFGTYDVEGTKAYQYQ